MNDSGKLSANTSKKSKIRIVYIFTLCGIVSWLGIIFFAPYIKSQSSDLGVYIYSIFSPICHQIPSRSFFIFHHPLAVCARCLGIYSGFLGGTALYPFLKGFNNITLPKTKNFILVSLPIVFDTMGNLFYLWRSSNWLRFLLGFIWGIILPFYFISGLSDYFIHTRQRRALKKID